MPDYRFCCTECGRVGTEDDGCELGGECPDEDCDGTIVANYHLSDDVDEEPDPYAIVDADSGTTYKPFIDTVNGIVGYIAERQGWDGPKKVHIYMCPSGGSDDGVPCVFVYIGEKGDPSHDPAFHHYNLDDWLGVGAEAYERYHANDPVATTEEP